MGCHKSKPANNDSPGAGSRYADRTGAAVSNTNQATTRVIEEHHSHVLHNYASNEELNRRIGELQAELRISQQTKQIEIDRLKEDKQALTEQISGFEETVKGLNQSISLLERTKTQQTSELNSLKNQLQTARNEHSKALRDVQQQKDRIQKELETARNELTAMTQLANEHSQPGVAKLESEIESLKTDIENFKSWTKKLDWSTANIPDALTKHYEIKQVDDVKGTFSDGTPFTRSGQTVDGVWHGPYVIVYDTDQTVIRGNYVNGEDHGERNNTRKGECPGEVKDMFWMGKNLNKYIKLNTDGGVQYKCADEEDKGVSVTVLTDETQEGRCYPVKNGYRIWLYTYNDEIGVEKVENDQTVSNKWYQL